MNLVAIETSTEYLSLAVARDGRVFERVILAGQRHSELLLDELDGLLQEAGLGMGDIDAVVFGAGPGSFTGLRIACGAAQGLALACGIPLLPVGCLEAVAEAAAADKVVVCLDARMGEVYHAAYVREAGNDGKDESSSAASRWRELVPPGLSAPGAVPLLNGGGWTGCGSGFALHGDVLRARFGTALEKVVPDLWPRASVMLRLALPRVLNNEGIDGEDAAPIYVRDKVALKTNER
jgi:tRNA threonylcarbamoyladenosine biosynthesis protein TsaB